MGGKWQIGGGGGKTAFFTMYFLKELYNPTWVQFSGECREYIKVTDVIKCEYGPQKKRQIEADLLRQLRPCHTVQFFMLLEVQFYSWEM